MGGQAPVCELISEYRVSVISAGFCAGRARGHPWVPWRVWLPAGSPSSPSRPAFFLRAASGRRPRCRAPGPARRVLRWGRSARSGSPLAVPIWGRGWLAGTWVRVLPPVNRWRRRSPSAGRGRGRALGPGSAASSYFLRGWVRQARQYLIVGWRWLTRRHFVVGVVVVVRRADWHVGGGAVLRGPAPELRRGWCVHGLVWGVSVGVWVDVRGCGGLWGVPFSLRRGVHPDAVGVVQHAEHGFRVWEHGEGRVVGDPDPSVLR